MENKKVFLLRMDYDGGIFWVSNHYMSFQFGGIDYVAKSLLDNSLEYSSGVGDVETTSVQNNVAPLRITNAQGILDQLIDKVWYGQNIKLYEGFSDQSALSIIGTGHRASFVNYGLSSTNAGTIEFDIAPLSVLLNTELQTTVFTGEGDDNIDDRPVPLAYGVCYGVKGEVKLDTKTDVKLNDKVMYTLRRTTYQLHEAAGNSLQRFNVVRGGGRALWQNSGPDTISKVFRFCEYESVVNALPVGSTVGLGQVIPNTKEFDIVVHGYSYTTGIPPLFQFNVINYSNGAQGRLLSAETLPGGNMVVLLTSGSAPGLSDSWTAPGVNGNVDFNVDINNEYYETADLLGEDIRFEVWGESDTSSQFQYDNITKPILERVLPSANIDYTSIDDTALVYPYQLGRHFSKAINVKEASQAFIPAGIISGFTNEAIPRYRSAALVDPAGKTPDHIIPKANIVEGSLHLSAASDPVWRVTIEGERNHAPISKRFESETINVASVTSVEARPYEEEFRVVRQHSSTTIRNNSPIPRTLTYQAGINNVASANFLASYAQQMFNLFSLYRRYFVFQVKRKNHTYTFGDIVEIHWPLFGFDQGVNAYVLLTTERPMFELTELLVWK